MKTKKQRSFLWGNTRVVLVSYAAVLSFQKVEVWLSVKYTRARAVALACVAAGLVTQDPDSVTQDL